MCKKLDELRSLYVLGDYEKTSANLMKKVEWNDIPVKIEVILDRLGIPFNEKEFTQSEAELKQNNIKVGVQGMVHVEKDNIEIFLILHIKARELLNIKYLLHLLMNYHIAFYMLMRLMRIKVFWISID